jgi:hypothetical protein
MNDIPFRELTPEQAEKIDNDHKQKLKDFFEKRTLRFKYLSFKDNDENNRSVKEDEGSVQEGR